MSRESHIINNSSLAILYIFSGIILIIGLLSCTKNKSSENILYEFDPRDFIEHKIVLSDIADDISYIPLDNRYPLGIIYDNIVFVNNSIYLSAKDIGILVLNEEGKTLRKIGSIGKGPGEYIYYSEFVIDEKTEEIYVKDAGDIIKVYSNTGKFLRAFSTREYGDYVYSISILDSKLFAFFQYKILTLNISG
jgi:hypothetical protein